MTNNTDPVRALIHAWRTPGPNNGEPYTEYDEGFDAACEECADALEGVLASAPPSAPDDVNRLVRELDVALNGPEGAAAQASLCDLVSQVQRIVRERGAPLLAPSAPVGVERLRRMVEKLAAHVRPTCSELWEEAQAALSQQAAAPVLAKYQPCGCVICTCEDEQQCQGCGAKHCGNRADHPPYVGQQPAAPSGEAVAWLRMKPDGTPDWAEDCIGSDDRFLDHELASDGYYLQPLYTAPQQPAAGEEIMVNAAHDVYTLPLQPSGLLSGPRFVVHVPGPKPPAAVDGRIAIEPGERLFQFDSKQEWINHASCIWRFHGVRPEDTVCVDALGRLVNIGKHFADAERDRAYPIVVYRLRADMNRNTGAAQQQGGAE